MDIDDARKDWVRLIESAAKGDAFIIARDGKPVVKVIPIASSADGHAGRLGFLAGKVSVPHDFDRMGQVDIRRRFSDEP